jgi:pilus assembly protein CpaB
MNPKRMLGSLALALMISGVATWMLSRKLSRPIAPVQVKEDQYVAPSRTLQPDEVLTPENTELVAWPENIPLEGAFTRSAELAGREALFPLAKGQPILDRDLSAPGARVGLASTIPNGMRAVALRSDEIVGVAGFLTPGSRLDVLVTFNPDHADPVTATVLENALVLAAGHEIEPDPNNKAVDATVVTLLLNPDQAQRAVLASTQGAIHFVLRNGGDAGQNTGAPVRLSQLSSGSCRKRRYAPWLSKPHPHLRLARSKQFWPAEARSRAEVRDNDLRNDPVPDAVHEVQIHESAAAVAVCLRVRGFVLLLRIVCAN